MQQTRSKSQPELARRALAFSALVIGALTPAAASSPARAASAANAWAAAAPASSAHRPVFAQDDAIARVTRVVVPALQQLAEWCEAQRLNASRLAAYEAVLEWSPDDSDARRILGWKRDKAGAWVRSRPAATARDRGGLEAELEAQRGAIADLALAELGGLEGAARVKLLRALRERLVAIAPDSEELRAALGQARHPDGGWARADAVRALGAAGYKELIAALRSNARAPERLEVTALDAAARDASVKWSGVARTPGALVASSVSFAEAAAIASAVDLAPQVARSILPPSTPIAGASGRPPVGDDGGGHPGWWAQPRFYVVQSDRDRNALIGALGKDLEPKKAALLRAVNTGYLDRQNSIGVWSAGAADRIEAAVRQRVGLYLQRAFGVTAERGWIWEGIGLLLSSSIVGTKNLVYVRLEASDRTVAGSKNKKYEANLFGPGADWLLMARDLARLPTAPKLGLLLGKDVNKMDKEDLLMAFALGTWLVDGHPELVAQVLGRIGAGQPPVEVLEAECGMPLPELELTLREWLEDMRRAP